MAYLLTPRWAKIADTSIRTLIYGFVALAGFGSVFAAPETVTGVVGKTLMDVSGWALMVAAIPGIIGASLRKYQFEWAAIWLVLGGSITYLVSLWTLLVNSDALTRLTSTAYISIAFLAIALRAIKLTVDAQQKRELFRVTNGD
ncbi:phage hypothetical protein [Stenotrophomonas virus Jojan60]|jgi:hypothetical protein|nr:phage hypothetical protein [Stenotrophomonas virus Jojan60]